MTPEQLLATNGIKLDSTAPGRHYATCPKCSATRSRAHQGNKVLGVTIEADGSVRWGCNHCGWTGPEKGVGGNGHQAGFAATYNYRDTNGNVLFQKVRNPPGHAPRFWLRRPDGRGGWINDTKGVNTKIIYRADDVAKAIADGRIVVVVEGEKDVDNVAAIGFTATCNAHGASELGKRPKWTRAHSEQLRGADIVVLNDNDSAGYAHADTTCRFSLGVAKRVRRLDLKPHWPDMPKGHDISDWLALGHTRAELDPLIAAAPDYQPEANEQAPTAGNAIDDAVEIEKLARMPAIEYDRERKAAGKRLGLSRLSLLDALVKAKRAELGFDADDGKQGHAIEFATPEPWPDSVDGAELLNGLAKAVRKYVALSDFARDTTALWTLHTYLIDRFLVSPRLGIHSPTKQCGKTTLLDILSRLALRSLSTANVTCAAIFRVIEGYQPTLLVDEADTFLHDNDELRGVLNGNRKGSQVLRTVGDDFEVRAFATYSACAIALIGSLPDRYLAPEGASQPPIRPERNEIRTSDISQPHSPDPGCAVGKFKKPDNDGLLGGCAVGKGESGQNERAEGGSGLAPGLSRRTLADLAHDYTERAYANAQENEGDTRTAELDAWLRQRLAAEGVLPEFVEVEFQRVMTEVFRV
jgi:hypothetical protein